jgi:kinesin family protein 4/21/27
MAKRVFDFRSMKQQKVRLVKQMKEEGEQFRQWKQMKEREVLKLKQNERKQLCEVNFNILTKSQLVSIAF